MNSYLYGNGRIAQTGSTTEYFLGDALGPVRQLADTVGAVTLTQSYAPYGETVSSVGSGSSIYQFAGESRDANGLTYLRARYLDSNTGRFTQKDPSRLEANLYLYAGANPVNRIDPSGYYSESVIKASLAGETINSAFGKRRYDVARWGLYWLLRDATPFTSFTLQNADFKNEKNPTYPLYSDADGKWVVFDYGCELLFQNDKWGFQTLPEFLATINQKAERNVSLSSKWWRPATIQYHWYHASNGRRYTDFVESTHMPDMLIINTSPGFLLETDNTYVRDMYGTVYYAAGGGMMLGGGAAERWEGYAKLNYSGNVPRSERVWKILSRSELKKIITGFGNTNTISIGTAGVGYSISQGGIAYLYGDKNWNLGVSMSFGIAGEAPQREFSLAWDWLNKIPRRSSP